MIGKENKLHPAMLVQRFSWVDGKKEIERLIAFCRRLGIDTLQMSLMRKEVDSCNFFP